MSGILLHAHYCVFQYIATYTEDLATYMFDRFMLHMAKCATAHQSLSQREMRRIHLTNLFLSCDHSGVWFTLFTYCMLGYKIAALKKLSALV